MGSPTSNPRVNIQLLPAAVVDAFKERQNLIVGQTGSGGTATSGALNQNVQSLTDTQIKALFGSDELYWKIKTWRDGVKLSAGGRVQPLDVIAVDPNGSAVAATGSVAFTGPATADGTLTVSVVDEANFTVEVAVTSGDTATAIAAAVDAALDGLTDLPVTPSNATGTLTLTANDGGTIGNYYGIKVSGNVAGVGYAITGFASGANDPTVTSIFDAIEGRRETGVAWPEAWQAQLSVATTEFDNRFNVANGVMDGVVFHGRSETYANALTAVSSLNSQSLVVMGNNVVALSGSQDGPAILKPADWVAIEFMAIRDKRLTTGAQIADFIVTTNGGLDNTGGPALASLPCFNTPLDLAPVTLPANLYTSTEQIDLEDKGFTQYGVNVAGNGMIMGPVVTTRTNDDAGNENDSFLYLNYVDTGSVCREIFFNTLRAVYSQSRLTQGDLIADRSIENEASIKEQLMKIYRVLADLVLVQAGSDAERYFSDNTTVTIDLVTRSVSIVGVLPIVTQIGTIDYNLALSFDITSSGTTISV